MLFYTALLCLSTIGTLAVPIDKADVNHKDYLLPDNVAIPSFYKIEIDVSNSFLDDEPKNFKGTVDITAQVKNGTNQIILHASSMTINRCEMRDGDNNDIPVVYEQEIDREFLILNITTITADKTIKILLGYDGTFQNDMHGFYVSSYTEGNNSADRKYVLTTQFQPTHARKAFPCFDEPKYKAKFSIAIKKPAEYKTVISNTKAQKSSETEVLFENTNKMSTYLVAFIVSNFDYVENNKNNDFKVWCRPEALTQAHEAVNAMFPLVDVLNKFTGISYNDYVNKLDMAALPDFSAGAMENWGLLTYRETALLFDDKVSTNRDLQRIITVIAHELGHQWFGNLVTTEWWDNTWLNEGFARYIEYMITGRYLPQWEMDLQFVVEQVQSIFEVDSLQKTTPLNRPVYTPQDISSHFGTISYSKGGSVIRMMEHFLGTDIFEKGLNTYLNHRKLSNTVPNNLWEDVDVIAKQYSNLEYPIDKIMNPWINQHGYPLVTVTVEKEFVTFEQKRFFLNPKENKQSNEKWFIPISYTTSSEKIFNITKPKLWLTPQEPKKIIELNVSDWIVANIQETGYFRVNYNDEHWKKIAETLTSKKENIDRINRAQIVDDIMNLARAGIIKYEIAFDVVDYLTNETDYYPWYSAFRVFRFLLQRYSESGEAGEQLRVYVKNLMKTLLKEKTLKELKVSKQTDIYNVISALEWACNLEDEQCVKDAKELFKNKFDNINKNFKSIVYCTAIRHGNEDDWDKLWNKYVSSNVAAEKIGIINALGCTKLKEKLESYLLLSVKNDTIRSQDASYVFSAVYTSGPEGVTAALNFLKDHATDIKTKYNGMNALDTAVLGLAGRLTENPQKDMLKIILKDEIFDNIRDAAMETTEENINWADQYSSSILTILKQKNSSIRTLINHFLMYLSLAFITIYYKRN